MPVIDLTNNNSNTALDLSHYKPDVYHINSTQSVITLVALPPNFTIATKNTVNVKTNLTNCIIIAKEINIEGDIEQTDLNADTLITIQGQIKFNKKKCHLSGTEIYLNQKKISAHESAIIDLKKVSSSTTHQSPSSAHSLAHILNAEEPSAKPSGKRTSETFEQDNAQKKLKIDLSPSPIKPSYFKHNISKPPFAWKEKTADLKLAVAKEINDRRLNEGMKILQSELEKWLQQAQENTPPRYQINDKSLELRFFQLRALVQYYNGVMNAKQKAVFTLPTGSGKTLISLIIIRCLLQGCRKQSDHSGAMVLTPNVDTANRIGKEFKEYAPDLIASVYHSGNKKIKEDWDVIITTPQSLILDQKERKEGKEQAKKFNYEKFIIISWDEAHLGLSQSRQREMKEQIATPNMQQLLTFTATPEFNTEKSVYRAMGYTGKDDPENPITPVTTLEAINEGELSPVTTFIVIPEIKQQEQQTLNDLVNNIEEKKAENINLEKFNNSISDIINTTAYNQLVAKIYFTQQNPITQQYFFLDNCIIFAADIAHAIALEKTFNQYEPGCARAVHSENKLAENNLILQEFHSGKFRVLINASMLAQGFDSTKITTVFNVAPSLSSVFEAQRCGRGLRFMPQKIASIIEFFWGITRQKLFKDFINFKYQAGIPETFIPLPPHAIPPQNLIAQFDQVVNYTFVAEDSAHPTLAKQKQTRNFQTKTKQTVTSNAKFILLNQMLLKLEKILGEFQEKLSGFNMGKFNLKFFQEKNPAPKILTSKNPNANEPSKNSENLDDMLLEKNQLDDFKLRSEKLQNAINTMLSTLQPESDQKEKNNNKVTAKKKSSEPQPQKQKTKKLPLAINKLKSSATSIITLFSKLQNIYYPPSSESPLYESHSSTTATVEDLDELLIKTLMCVHELQQNLENNGTLILENLQTKARNSNTLIDNSPSTVTSSSTTISRPELPQKLSNNLNQTTNSTSHSESEAFISYKVDSLSIYDTLLTQNKTPMHQRLWFPAASQMFSSSHSFISEARYPALKEKFINHNYFDVTFKNIQSLNTVEFTQSVFSQVKFMNTFTKNFTSSIFEKCIFEAFAHATLIMNNCVLVSNEFKGRYNIFFDKVKKSTSLNQIPNKFELSAENACIKDSDLSHDNFEPSIFLTGEFISSNFKASIFKNASFKSLKIDNCSFEDANFEFTKFVNVHFIKCNFTNATLLNSTWINVTFQECKFDNRIIDGTCEKYQNFSTIEQLLSLIELKIPLSTQSQLKLLFQNEARPNSIKRFSIGAIEAYNTNLLNFSQHPNAKSSDRIYFFPTGQQIFHTEIVESKEVISLSPTYSEHHYFSCNFNQISSLCNVSYHHSEFSNLKIIETPIKLFKYCNFIRSEIILCETPGAALNIESCSFSTSKINAAGMLYLNSVKLTSLLDPNTSSMKNYLTFSTFITQINNCAFSDSFFQHCSFSNGQIIKSLFSNANLHYNNFINVNIIDCNFEKVNLLKTNFAALSDNPTDAVTIEGCNFSSTDFSKVSFTNIIFTGINFSNTKFNECKWKNVRFKNCKFKNFVFSGSIPQNVIYEDFMKILVYFQSNTSAQIEDNAHELMFDSLKLT